MLFKPELFKPELFRPVLLKPELFRLALAKFMFGCELPGRPEPRSSELLGALPARASVVASRLPAS
jgi:hypothetical protein